MSRRSELSYATKVARRARDNWIKISDEMNLELKEWDKELDDAGEKGLAKWNYAKPAVMKADLFYLFFLENKSLETYKTAETLYFLLNPSRGL
jgi:hypothetical protein